MNGFGWTLVQILLLFGLALGAVPNQLLDSVEFCTRAYNMALAQQRALQSRYGWFGNMPNMYSNPSYSLNGIYRQCQIVFAQYRWIQEQERRHKASVYWQAQRQQSYENLLRIRAYMATPVDAMVPNVQYSQTQMPLYLAMQLNQATGGKVPFQMTYQGVDPSLLGYPNQSSSPYGPIGMQPAFGFGGPSWPAIYPTGHNVAVSNHLNALTDDSTRAGYTGFLGNTHLTPPMHSSTPGGFQGYETMGLATPPYEYVEARAPTWTSLDSYELPRPPHIADGRGGNPFY